jgi:hypothetical protein
MDPDAYSQLAGGKLRYLRPESFDYLSSSPYAALCIIVVRLQVAKIGHTRF